MRVLSSGLVVVETPEAIAERECVERLEARRLADDRRVEERVRQQQHWREEGARLLCQLDAMPAEAHLEVLGILKSMLLSRGHRGMFAGEVHRDRLIDQVAAVFAENGFSQEEYT